MLDKLATQVAWQPPKNYREIESVLPGITVFAPAPEAKPENVPLTYQCPHCGAATQFDVASGGIACEHCGYIAPVQAQKVGKNAGEFEFTLEALAQAAKGWGTNYKLMHCDQCGAELSLPEGALTITCPFCASNKVNIRMSPLDQFRPRYLVPFKIQPGETSQRAKLWMVKGWFHPKQLKDNAVINRFLGIYLSFWTFSALVNSSWRAEVGYERQESYYDSATKTRRTRTVIDWQWRNGSTQNNFTDLLLSGNQRVSHHLLNQLYPFNLSELVTYNPDFLAGWQAQAYDILLNDAWNQAKVTMRDRAKQTCYDDINSIHIRNFSMAADFSDESWRYILLPVYMTAYRFNEKSYQVMINGQTGAIAGQKPVVWWKVWLVIALLLLPGLILGLISLPLLAAGGVGVLTLFFSLILVVIGAAIAYSIYRKAAQSEAA